MSALGAPAEFLADEEVDSRLALFGPAQPEILRFPTVKLSWADNFFPPLRYWGVASAVLLVCWAAERPTWRFRAAFRDTAAPIYYAGTAVAIRFLMRTRL